MDNAQDIETAYGELFSRAFEVSGTNGEREGIGYEILRFRKGLETHPDDVRREFETRSDNLLTKLLRMSPNELRRMKRRIDLESRREEISSRDASYFSSRVGGLERRLKSVKSTAEYSAIFEEACGLKEEFDIWHKIYNQPKAGRKLLGTLTKTILPLAELGSKYGSPENPIWRLSLVPREEGACFAQEMIGGGQDPENSLTNPDHKNSPEWYVFFDGKGKITPFVPVFNDKDPRDPAPLLRCYIIEAAFGKVPGYRDKAVEDLVCLSREEDFGRQTGYRGEFVLSGFRAPLGADLASRLGLYPCKEIEDNEGLVYIYRYHASPNKTPSIIIRAREPVVCWLAKGATI